MLGDRGIKRRVPVAVKVTEPPLGRFTLWLMLPEPLAVQLPPPAPTQVQLQVRLAGKVSITVALPALFGPALLATMVYVVLPPGVLLVVPLVLVMDRSAPANSVIVKYDSSWNPEEPQTANVTVSFDGGPEIEITRYESATSSAKRSSSRR